MQVVCVWCRMSLLCCCANVLPHAAIMWFATSLPGGGVSRADENRVTIAAAGAIEPLVELLRSPAAGVQEESAWALRDLAWKGACGGC